jgi:MYXO-CTERM domain-containing protein
MRARVLAATAAALFLSTLAPSRADAFCRMWTCDRTKESCPVDPDNKTCQYGGDPARHKRLYWPQSCVGFSIQQDTTTAIPGTADARYAIVEKIANTAFATWQNAKCSDGNPPSLAFADLGPVACRRQEYNPKQGNANIVLFREDTWPYGKDQSTAYAITTDTYNVESGEIYDADIEVNAHPVGGTITTGDTNVSIDLLSVLTHEAGHFIGLGLSPDPSATMSSTQGPGSTDHRVLGADDVAGVCAMYPSSRVNLPACDPTPRHGLSSDCAEVTTSPSGCSTSSSPVGATGGLAAAFASIAAALIARRRRRS